MEPKPGAGTNVIIGDDDPFRIPGTLYSKNSRLRSLGMYSFYTFFRNLFSLLRYFLRYFPPYLVVFAISYSRAVVVDFILIQVLENETMRPF